MDPHSYVAAHQVAEKEKGKDDERRNVGVVIEQSSLEADNGWMMLG